MLKMKQEKTSIFVVKWAYYGYSGVKNINKTVKVICDFVKISKSYS